MSNNTIPNEDAELLLHRYVTERLPILAFFVSANKSIEVKLGGFLVGSTQSKGLFIATEWPDTKPGASMPSFMRLTGANGSWCEYSDESEVPAEILASGFGSTLRLNMPNGDTLYIVETQPIKKK